MLTIGEFARATGLTAKALRLYDDLGLLAPADVDAHTGYRRYTADQVNRARLVARLRSVGVPLRRIATIVGLDDREAAAAELLSYWRQVEADTASSRHVVAALVSEMRGHDMHPTATHHPAPRSAHRAGRGGRSLDLDRVHPREHRVAAQVTGQRVFAVADGYGEDGAADAALEALASLDGAEQVADPLGALDATVTRAAEAVAARGVDAGGTTLTALLLAGDRALVAHVGDSRAYVVRDGSLERLTRDHTVVQSLIDEGRLTADEARSDPDRNLLNRALAPGAPAAPDLSVRQLHAGDRFVLTTDGVHSVLEPRRLAELLLAPGTPEEVTHAVEAAVLAAGAPDNYGVVVVDV
ncbi:MerR family transcriptional regulator [Nocardioides KLBMP 9356]|uniref:MerR family transcriptional regulator n=1 Tax=Nocardioides potassii TaxID=2911371 RepID=A0ABS9H9I4_9ACTN|nr:MerR family transcriptional regulator [Nocardioides potassii]MCF6376876.1 MerR family transcriptional regulator [Nocardioides potassii]